MSIRDRVKAYIEEPQKPRPVETPVGTVYVPVMTARQFVEFAEAKTEGEKLAVLIVDEHGTRQFTAVEAAVLDRAWTPLFAPVMKAFNEANGLTDGPKG